MKTITQIVISLIVATISISCTTNEKFTISTPIGTKITLPMTGSIEPQLSDKGNIKITVPSEGYCGYVLATLPDSGVPVPMGLNLKRNKHYGTKLALGCGYTFTGAGIGGMLGSLIVIIGAEKNGDDDISSASAMICGASAAVSGIGCAIGIPSQARLRQTTYDYSFGYVKNQVLDLPQLSMTLLHPNPEKNTPMTKDGSESSRKKASSGKANESSSVGTKVNKSRNALANKVAGKFIGTGQLLQNKTQDEFYSEIEVEITLIDKNFAKVRIIESEEDFFEEPLIYSVKKGKKGDYNLTIDEIPGAVITITKSGTLNLTHPKVNIDGVIYKLVIKANKH